MSVFSSFLKSLSLVVYMTSGGENFECIFFILENSKFGEKRGHRLNLFNVILTLLKGQRPNATM